MPKRLKMFFCKRDIMQLLITKIAKVAQKYSSLFSPIAAQTAQTEEFIFQNVTYRETVYRTEG